MTSTKRAFLLAVVLTSLAAACLDPSATATPIADAAVAPFTLQALDFSGEPAALDDLPRRPRILLTAPAALDASDEPIALFEGALDADALADLERAPLQRVLLARQVPSVIEYRALREIAITPRAPLAPGATYTLAVAGYARDLRGARLSEDGLPFTAELTVSPLASAGASVIGALPAADTSGVPSNLRFCALVLDGEARGAAQGVWLEGPDGLAVPTQTLEVPCAELDSRGHTCITLVPSAPLSPLTRYTLRTGRALRDARGAEVSPVASSFVTGPSIDREPARLQPLSCAADERSLPFGCALVDDRRVVLRAQANEPVRYLVREGLHVHAELAPRGALTWTQTGLTPRQTMTLEVRALDAAGNETLATTTLTTEDELAPLSLTEVLADPLGPEPAQEWIELASFGAEPVALRGFTLADGADGATAIDSDAIVYPGARVLLVPDAFDPQSALDATIPEGTTLVRVGKALGRSGLANAGEAVYLRDERGRRVSAAPATPRPRAGACLVRVADDPRTSEAGSFGYDANGTCTPGR